MARSYSTEDALAAGKGPIYKTKCHTQSMLIRHKYMKGLCACTQVKHAYTQANISQPPTDIYDWGVSV